MTDAANLADAPHALLLEIERKDRRFRRAQTLFFFLIAIILAMLLVSGASQLSDTKKEIANQNRTLATQTQILNTLKKGAAQRTSQINDLQNHIDCIVALDGQTNRSQLTITDFQGCKITSNGVTSPLSTPSSVTKSTPSVPQKSQPTTTVTPSQPTSTPSTTPSTSTTTSSKPESGLDKLPVVGGIFKALGV